MKKVLSVILAIIVFLDVVAISVLLIDRSKGGIGLGENVKPNESVTDETGEVTQVGELFSRVSVVAVGDNLIHDTVYEQAAARSSGGYDFEYAYQNIAHKIESKDVAILNQETIISTDHNVSSYPTFNSPVEVGEEMLEIGFDVFNIATNHSVDCGEKGLISTINYWKSKNAITTGAYLNEADYQNIPMHEVNGVKIAYVGYTGAEPLPTNGISLPSDTDVILMRVEDEERIRQRVMAAKEIADFVVVNAHWGEEYTHEPSEIQKEFARKLGEWGADVIIGTHPHVIQPVEFIDNPDGSRTLVAYSLGNFISAQNRGPRMLGGMLNFDLVKNNTTGETTVENVRFEGTVTHYGYGCSNIRVYPLSEYTEELASKHGVISKTPSFSLEYLYGILEEVIDVMYLIKN